MLKFQTKQTTPASIKIQNSFKVSKPSPKKIEKCYSYYLEHGTFDRAIIVDKGNLLLDGYVAYLVAKMLDVERVKVVQISGIEYNCSQFGTEYHPDKVKFKPEPQYYNGEIVCVKNIAGNESEFFTPGKVYKVKDGIVRSNTGNGYNLGEPIKSITDLDDGSWMSQFIEYKGE